MPIICKNIISEHIENTLDAINQTRSDSDLLLAVEEAGNISVAALRNNKKIMFAGNGGSAADAQHLAAELVSRLNYDRPGLAGIALTTDTSALTAIGNDYGFDYIFARQIEAIGQEGDVFFALSTSGNSPNILSAIEAARKKNIKIVGMSGESGGKMVQLCDIIIKIPSHKTPHIQECHIMLGHIICQIIEDSIFKIL